MLEEYFLTSESETLPFISRDKNGNAIIPYKYEDAEPFSRGKAKVKFNSKTFYINKSGDEV